MIQLPIPTFIINLKKRNDRKAHILEEFRGRTEFSINLVEPIFDKIGAVSLWKTINHIIQNLAHENDEYILICEDDHQFTDAYSKLLFSKCIDEAIEKKADVLSGGVHWFNSGLQITDHLFWVDRFTATQFIIIFKHFFNTILRTDFSVNDTADYKISALSNSKFFIAPFISVQKDFGYSDATFKNNVERKMEKLFAKSSANVQMLKDVVAFYTNQHLKGLRQESFGDISIPTYIISHQKKVEASKYIEKEFVGKKEFEITIVEGCKHDSDSVSLWLSLRKIIEMAIANDDDVIIICEDSHEFTGHYSRNFLIKNIIEAYDQGVEILLGSVGSFGLAVPIAINRVWLNHFYNARFMILYRSVFQKILNEPFDDNIKFDAVLSYTTSRKMVFFPPISTQHDSPNDGFMDILDEDNELCISLLEGADKKLIKIYEALNTHHISL